MQAHAIKSTEEAAAKIREENIGLTAVTMPHKQSIMPFLDEIDEDAKKIGAVNTVINRNGKLHGYNTDLAGIEYALRDHDLVHKTVVIIGAGGAARAAAYAMQKAGAKLLIINRSEGPARELAEEFGGEVISEIPKDATLVINATPLDNLQIPEQAVFFDMNYTKNRLGLEMFVAQGFKQIELWTGCKKLDPKKYYEYL